MELLDEDSIGTIDNQLSLKRAPEADETYNQRTTIANRTIRPSEHSLRLHTQTSRRHNL